MPPKKKAKTKVGSERDQAISGAEALQLKAKLEAGEQLDDSTLLRLLKADKPCEGLYSKACKGKQSANPNCLCNLIPAPNAYRRTGLWAKNADGSSALGPDPALSRRVDPGSPIGLRNLGNTCYVNSVLQCLFANEAFRSAVYAAGAAKGPLAGDPVISVLRDLFISLQHGASSPVDPTPLVAALNLDHAVQQDGQEFMKLFLTLIEHKLAAKADLKDAVQGLFRGFAGYETVCQDCGQPSESSARADSFYELDVPVKGFKNLSESLSALLGPETLTGDNQYYCERCSGKRDATRQLRVRGLPPLLCLSLQRFVFDLVKLDRVKVTDKFAFPLELNATALILGGASNAQAEQAVRPTVAGTGVAQPSVAGAEATTSEPNVGSVDNATVAETGQPQPQRGKEKPAEQEEQMYDLEAILIHKGTSATHGHYVAHIKVGEAADGSGGAWWRFDDETVAKMKDGPLFSSDHGGGGSGPSGGGGGGKVAGEKQTEGKGKAAGGSGRGGRGRGGIKKAAAGRGGKSKGGKKKEAGAGSGNMRGSSKHRGRGQKGKRGGRGGGGRGSAERGNLKREVWETDEDDEVAERADEDGLEDEEGRVGMVDAKVPEVVIEMSDDGVAQNGADAVVDLSLEEDEDKEREGGEKPAAAMVKRRRVAATTATAGTHSAAGGGGGAVTTTKQSAKGGRKATKEAEAHLAEDASKKGDASNVIERKGNAVASSSHANEIASTNAYLLVYRRRGARLDGVQLDDEIKAWLESSRARFAEEYEGRCAEYAANKQAAAERAASRRKEVRAIVEAAVATPQDDAGRFVSAEWLQTWADADATSLPPPLDNSPLLCQHGKLDPSRVAAARRLPTHVYSQIVSSSRGGPELAPCDVCTLCLGEQLAAIAAKEDSEEARERYVAVAAALDAQHAERAASRGDEWMDDDDDATTDVDDSASLASRYYVSKTWLDGWRRREGRTMGVTPPTAALECPHGGLLPEHSGKTKRVAIPRDFWAYVQRSWAAAEAERLRKARLRAAKARGGGGGGGGGGNVSVDVVQDGNNNGGGGRNESDPGEKNDDGDVIMMIDDDSPNGARPGSRTYHDNNEHARFEAPVGHGATAEASDVLPICGADGGSGGALSDETHVNGASKPPSQAEAEAEVVAADQCLNAAQRLPEFPASTEECPVCAAEHYEAAKTTRGLQGRRDAERAALGHLLNPGFLQFEPGMTYRLVPARFMDHWRGYMSQGRGAAAAAVSKLHVEPLQPPSLAAALASVLLEQPQPPTAPRGDGTTADVAQKTGGDDVANDQVISLPSSPVAPPANPPENEQQSGASNSQRRRNRRADGGMSSPRHRLSNPPHPISDEEEQNQRYLLAYPPPAVALRRGRWVLAAADGPIGAPRASTEAWEALSCADWSSLLEFYVEEGMPLGVHGIEATLVVEHVPESNAGAGCADDRKDNDVAAGLAGTCVDADKAPPREEAIRGGDGGGGGGVQPKPEGKDEKLRTVEDGADVALAVAGQDGNAAGPVGGEAIPAFATKKEEEPNPQNVQQESTVVTAKPEETSLDTGSNPYRVAPYRRGSLRSRGSGAETEDSRMTVGRLVTKPDVCAVTVAEGDAATKAARLTYHEEEILVEIVSTVDDAVAATLAAAEIAMATHGGLGSHAVVGGGGGVQGVNGATKAIPFERKSRRARKNRAPVVVDCTTTVSELKLRIYQALGTHPRNIRLFVRGEEVHDTSSGGAATALSGLEAAAEEPRRQDNSEKANTLAGCEIYPGEEVRIVDTKEYDSEDLTGIFGSPTGGTSGGPKGGGRTAEGFGGTALAGLDPVGGEGGVYE